MRYIVIVFFLFSSLFAQKLIQPLHTYKISQGLATDVLYTKNRLYISSDSGTVDIFNTKSKKKIQSIQLDKIKDFMGDEIASKIFTLDLLDQSLLILSQDNGGYSRVHLYQNKKLMSIITNQDKLNIIKAKFIDKNTILLALISNDIISYNIKTHTKNWTIQASMSKFSNFSLNNDRTKVAIADESGDVHVIYTKDGKKFKTLTGENVDNIFGVAFRNNIVLTGGQDRRAAVYNLKNSSSYHKLSKFFVYGVGLSPDGKIGAYSCDLDNNIEVFNTLNRENLGKFQGTKKVVNSIYFINENEFFLNSNSKDVLYYKLK